MTKNKLKENSNNTNGTLGNYLKAILVSTMMLYSNFAEAQHKKYYIDSIDYKNKITDILKGIDKDSLLKECDTIITKGNELISLKLNNKDSIKQKEIINFFNKKLEENYSYSRKLIAQNHEKDSINDNALNGNSMNGFIQGVARKSRHTLSKDQEIQLEKDKKKLMNLLFIYLQERENNFIRYVSSKLQVGKEEDNDIFWDLSTVYDFQSGGYMELPEEAETMRKQKKYELPKGTHIKIFIEDLREMISYQRDVGGHSYIDGIVHNFEEKVRDKQKISPEEFFQSYKEDFKTNGYFENNK